MKHDWPLAAAAAAMLTACGQSGSPSSAASSASDHAPAKVAVAAPKACDVLNDALAKKYLGADAQLRRNAQPNPRMTQCQWGSERGVITIMVGPWDDIHDTNPADKAVSGLGDEAYDAPDGLDVRKGDLGVNIDIITQSGEFWGSAADDMTAQMIAAEHKVAPDIVASL